MEDMKSVAGLTVPIDLETGTIDWNGFMKSYICYDSDISSGYHNNIAPYIENGSTLLVMDTGVIYVYGKSNTTWNLL